MIYDVIIIGGGAAGLFCAAEAGRRGRKVLVIEHNTEVGRKILISGGGRCNFTNINTTVENFVSRNPHFAKSALSRYTPRDFIELVKQHRIEFYEKKLGQLFCRDRSTAIVQMLMAECRRAKVKVETGCSVLSVEKEDRFVLSTSRGRLEAESLVIASGGLSFPKIGATNFGYTVARQFGLRIEPTRASLVALVAKERSKFAASAGVSADATVSAGHTSFRENILVTHRGLSGPAVQQASNYWTVNGAISVDLLPDIDMSERLVANNFQKRKLVNFLGELLPEKLLQLVVDETALETPVNQLGNKRLKEIGSQLNDWKLVCNDTEGWHKAEVTIGGVSTDELSSKTMESKKVPGLFFIGEVIDVTGWLGGYNFQWAWSSAHAAGNAV